MPQIQLQFSRQGGPVSSLIAWFGKGEFSHVDAVMGDGLYGARSDCNPGVRLRTKDYTKFVKKTIFTIPVTKEQFNRFNKFLQEQYNKPYDRLAILGFITGRNWRERDSWICSELQAAALEYAEVVPKLYLAVNKIDPCSLALTISAIKGINISDD